MPETFAEKEKERKTTAVLPLIRREQAELHSVMEALGNCAANINTHSEGAYSTSAKAEQAARIAANVQAVLPEGSVPLPTRFVRLLSSM
jgi:hypothetical protein